MSRSPLGTVPEEGSGYISSFIELAHRIRAGASFSGRERNCAFLNVGGTAFANASAALGLDFEQDSRGLGFCDWDHDGDLDLWLTNRGAPKVQLIQNQNAVGDRKSVALLLEGDPKRSCPRDAAGARAVIGELTRTVHLGDGFVSQSSRWLHFGLGGGEQVDAVTVHWPGGTAEKFSGVDEAGRYHLKQGTGVAQPAPDLGLTPLAIKPLKIPEPTETSRIWFSQLEPLPSEVDLPQLPEGAFILSLWASWCAPCMAELAEYGAAGDIPVVPINVENADDPAAISEEMARELLRTAGIDHAGSFADAQLIEHLNTFIRDRIYAHRNMPLPTSFLIDSNRNVRAVYRGRFSAEVIRADLAQAVVERTDAHTELDATVPFAGRWSTEFFKTAPLKVAGAYREGGYLEDARAYLERFLVEAGGEGEAAQRRMADLHQAIGVIDQLEGDDAAAVERFRQTLASYPENVPVNIQLILSLAEAGRVDEALERVRVLKAAMPNNANFLNLEADVQRSAGEYAKAIGGYRQVLAVNQRYIPAIIALAELLATAPDPAVREGGEAVELAEFLAGAPGARDNSRFVTALADAYAETGEFDRALREARRVKSLLTPYGDDESLREINERIALFEQEKAYYVEPR